MNMDETRLFGDVLLKRTQLYSMSSNKGDGTCVPRNVPKLRRFLFIDNPPLLEHSVSKTGNTKVYTARPCSICSYMLKIASRLRNYTTVVTTVCNMFAHFLENTTLFGCLSTTASSPSSVSTTIMPLTVVATGARSPSRLTTHFTCVYTAVSMGTSMLSSP